MNQVYEALRRRLDSLKRERGTGGRAYGGDPGLVHVKDGQRNAMGQALAHHLDTMMRHQAIVQGLRSPEDALSMPLCPGCVMIVLFDASVHAARATGQPLYELGRTMAAAYTRLADCIEQSGDEAACLEEMDIVLDR